jgi:hypothetical protein
MQPNAPSSSRQGASASNVQAKPSGHPSPDRVLQCVKLYNERHTPGQSAAKSQSGRAGLLTQLVPSGQSRDCPDTFWPPQLCTHLPGQSKPANAMQAMSGSGAHAYPSAHPFPVKVLHVSGLGESKHTPVQSAANVQFGWRGLSTQLLPTGHCCDGPATKPPQVCTHLPGQSKPANAMQAMSGSGAHA